MANTTTSDAQNSSIMSVAKYYKVIVLDCTQVQFVDESAVKTLKEIINEYKKENVKFYMTNCSGKIPGFWLLIPYFLTKMDIRTGGANS